MTTTTETYVPICTLDQMTPERGSAALLPEGTQIAVFLLDDGSLHAVQQHDPYSGTNILSRGLVGTHDVAGPDGAAPTVIPTLSSPMYKQSWNLDTGEVLDAGGGESHPIDVYDVRLEGDTVLVSTSPRSGAAAGDATA